MLLASILSNFDIKVFFAGTSSLGEVVYKRDSGGEYFFYSCLLIKRFKHI
jgi:hypothetical protein